jgi:nucleotide-binding universal stress UspA family protein
MAFQNILVAYDQSELSRKALDKAVKLAGENGANLYIVHVYQPPAILVSHPLATFPSTYLDDAEVAFKSVKQELQEQAEKIPKASVALLSGHPAKALLDYAYDKQCDLIVMGSRGLGGLQELVLGSVSHSVVQQSKIPVLVIK